MASSTQPQGPSYGLPRTNSISVFVRGPSIEHPGRYVLPEGAVLPDAVQVAGLKQGLEHLASRWCVIYRMQPNGFYRSISFPNRQQAERAPLQDGDTLFVRHFVE
jgi:hypothetical protein